MTNTPSLETEVASAARAWREASRGTSLDAREAPERRLADTLERWLAGLLATDAHWPHQGRWYDGLVFHECLSEDGDRFHLRGHIWHIDQTQHPFRVTLQLSTEGLAAFEVDLAHGPPAARRRAEPEWTFHFARGG